MINDRRKSPRIKASVPVEVHVEGAGAPLHCSTSDISLGGCYIESMYPFPVGTCLELKLQIADTLLVVARVVTCDPQFGNGIAFVKILPEDRDKLTKFINSAAHQGARAQSTSF